MAERYIDMEVGDVTDYEFIGPVVKSFQPDAIVHFGEQRCAPLQRIVEWLSTIAEAGVVEFASKSDPMVQALLRTRQDVYSGYTEAAFEEALREHFRITDVARLPNSGRILYLFCSK